MNIIQCTACKTVKVLAFVIIVTNYGGGNEDNGDLLQKVPCMHCYTLPPMPQQATINPRLHWRLPDTHGQVWVSLLWGHCSFLLGPGAHKVLFVPSKNLITVTEN